MLSCEDKNNLLALRYQYYLQNFLEDSISGLVLDLCLVSDFPLLCGTVKLPLLLEKENLGRRAR